MAYQGGMILEELFVLETSDLNQLRARTMDGLRRGDKHGLADTKMVIARKSASWPGVK